MYVRTHVYYVCMDVYLFMYVCMYICIYCGNPPSPVNHHLQKQYTTLMGKSQKGMFYPKLNNVSSRKQYNNEKT